QRPDQEPDVPFENRASAGRDLAAALARYKESKPVVLALPRGGVPVAAEVAAALGAPLDLLLVRKIGVPGQPELAMGAVTDGASPVVVRNEDIIRRAGVSEAEFAAIRDAEIAEIERRRKRYLGGRAPAEVKGRTVIVIDDGVATGATMRTALRAVRARAPKELVLAVPVAAEDTLEDLRAEADTAVCLEAPRWLDAVGFFYNDFRQTTDSEVVAILARFPSGTATDKAG
ncbi:MAG TPA: phosphoribosyltransferase family protein, partial [Methylocella sp.]|nr:phosphoribosyltransferase family protein [Methylocella sp.]